MNKHAYLVTAHSNWEQLKLLLGALDHINNDIFLHIDRKAFSPSDEEINSWVTKSKMFIYHKYRVAWGGDTQVKCNLFLLRKAVEHNYAYYHLISGVDIPLKTQNEIHRFFEASNGKNFIGVNLRCNITLDHLDRIRYYHLLQNYVGRPPETPTLGIKVLCKVENLSLQLQKFLKINRIYNKSYTFYKGSSWFSITHKFATFVVAQKRSILKSLKFSLGGDEYLMQTLIMNSEFSTTLVNDNLRYIDWSSSDQPGAPKTFTIDDYDAIVNSDKLFARKFDLNKDSTIIYKLYQNLT